MRFGKVWNLTSLPSAQNSARSLITGKRSIVKILRASCRGSKSKLTS